MASSDSQIDKPQHGRPKRAELPHVIINTGTQSINSESLFKQVQVNQMKVIVELSSVFTVAITT